MNKEQDDKIQEILNQQGPQGRVNSAIVIAGAEVTDETTKKIKEDAEATKRAAEILKELEANNKIQKNIAEISEEIKQQLYKKSHLTENNIQYFSSNSIHQSAVDKYVREADQYIYDEKTGKYVKKEIIDISKQVAKKIAEKTMEKMIQEAERPTKGNEER